MNEMKNRYENDIYMLKKQYEDLSEKKNVIFKRRKR
jgi:hypothetical protein